MMEFKIEQAQYLLDRKWKLSILTAILVAAYVATNFYFYAYGCFGDFETFEDFDVEVLNPIKRATFTAFMLLAISYFTVGCILLSRLKKHFGKLHEQWAGHLWTALILLTVPLTLRGALDLFHIERHLDRRGYQLAVYNVLFSLTTTFLPIIFQISSLVFGFIRRKQSSLVEDSSDGRAETGDPETITLEESEADHFDDMLSEKSGGYFDPPVENYRFVYLSQRERDMARGREMTRSNRSSVVRTLSEDRTQTEYRAASTGVRHGEPDIQEVETASGSAETERLI